MMIQTTRPPTHASSSTRRSTRCCAVFRHAHDPDDHARQNRARLERAFLATSPRVTAEGMRVAMARRLDRLHDVALRRDTDGRLAFVVLADLAPVSDRATYMRKLAVIAETISDLGVVHVVLRAIELLPREGVVAALTIPLGVPRSRSSAIEPPPVL